ncbi:MAG: FtsX-like permease family protein [Planctomycetaceae bacterium]
MFSYALRGLWHYRRSNVVVMLAVAISTAVIGGSLIVGDSVRFSLQRMTQQRLGQITHVLHSPRFFRQDLAAELSANDSWKPTASSDANTNLTESPVCAAAILLTGSVEATTQSSGDLRRAGSVTLLGVDTVGWQLLDHGGVSLPVDREIVLGYRTAKELQVQAGDEVSVWVEVPASIPRDSLLGERSEVTVELVLSVSSVLPETVGASRFDLNPGQQLPYNAFLPLATIQERLGLEQVEVSRRNPVAKPARVNSALVGFPLNAVHVESASADQRSTLVRDAQIAADRLAVRVGDLNSVLQQALTLQDVELSLRPVTDRGYISVESQRMILDDATASTVIEAADSMGLSSVPTIVYLTNEIRAADAVEGDKRYSMYSIVAGLPFGDANSMRRAKLADGSAVPDLGDDDILLSSWLAKDLNVVAGDTIVATWHEVGSHGELPEVVKSFSVAGILADDDEITMDRNLTPHVEGVTDVEDFGDIRQPFEMDMARLTERDDDYWKEYRATPKAFVTLQTAETLWSSRYGRFTSIRVGTSAGAAKPSEDQLNNMASRLEFEILHRLKPADLGLAFRPVRAEGLQAAVGANDFTQLFIGFSFFLILSAIILASLMFRLGIQQRISQMGLLSAVGWPDQRVRRLFLSEGLLVCACGAIVGAIAAVWFAKLMIYGLTTWWVGAVGTQFLLLDIQPARLVLAIVISLALATIVILLALRAFRDISLRDQLAGNAAAAEQDDQNRAGWWSKFITATGLCSVVAALVVPGIVIAGLVPDGEAFGGLTWQMVCFFVAGFACLNAGLYVLRVILRRRSARDTIQVRSSGLGGLAIANAARNPSRSLLTTALIAFATFVIVAVGAGRRNPLSETPDLKSGNGGFSLVAESAQPILYDLNTADGRSKLAFTADQSAAIGDANVFAFAMKPGADASCVNLYQTRIPTMLGASPAFIARGGFRFADTKGDNPWQQLDVVLPDTQITEALSVPTIPVLGDMNTLMYSLKKGPGSNILVPDENDPKFALQVVGMLDGSVFQGVLLMTDVNLKRVDPDVVGARYFLIETPDLAAMDSVSTSLESALNDYGLDAEPVSERLAGFLAVQNTYLSTFQMLGGLGLLVGTFGLAAVMLRNVVERRREIALMRAVGFTTARVSKLILSENSVLLLWGILLGTGSALLAMLPHLRSTGADLPWQPLLLTLLAVAVIGSLASVFAVRAATMLSIRDNLAAE